MQFKSMKVAVLGARKSGVAAANLLASHGAKVVLSDIASEEILANHLGRLNSDVVVHTGGHTLEGVSLVVVSPGIPPSAAIFGQIKSKGLPVWSEIELAYRLCKAPIAAITGTDGKTTTTELLGSMCRKANLHTWVGGNIGTPLCEGVQQVPESGVVVAEVSCFQLLHIDRFRPRVGALLNVAPDHLDYHASMEEYTEAKKRIFKNMGAGDTAVLNANCPVGRAVMPNLTARSVLFSHTEPVHGGVYYDGKDLIAEGLPGGPHRLLDRNSFPLQGSHNVENALAASAAALALGIPPSSIGQTLSQFQSLPGRLETVGWADGVRYVNDTKATNPHAAAAGLRCFSEPVILIAGGVDKGLALEELLSEVEGRCKAVILIGQIRERMAMEMDGRVSHLALADSMQQAVEKACKMADRGDVVLLGPACSSFDMFESYIHRGEAFKSKVIALNGYGEER